ncbi:MULTISPECIES: hypothetical protein [unclassified Isoptericola]|uniref:hypothetical protein n=1 Tax=Isoptericola sp. NPDC057191 TaxID=3346041 RepID=UPI003628BD6B
MSRSARPARTVAAASVMAGALLLAACSPTITTKPYAPSDGVRVNLTDQVRGINLMVVSEGEGEPGNLLGAVANDSAEDVDVVLTAEGADPLSVTVPAGGTIYLNADQEGAQVEDPQIAAVAAQPGGDLDATLSGAGVDQDFFLPVMDGTLPEYKDYVPSATAS